MLRPFRLKFLGRGPNHGWTVGLQGLGFRAERLSHREGFLVLRGFFQTFCPVCGPDVSKGPLSPYTSISLDDAPFGGGFRCLCWPFQQQETVNLKLKHFGRRSHEMGNKPPRNFIRWESRLLRMHRRGVRRIPP